MAAFVFAKKFPWIFQPFPQLTVGEILALNLSNAFALVLTWPPNSPCRGIGRGTRGSMLEKVADFGDTPTNCIYLKVSLVSPYYTSAGRTLALSMPISFCRKISFKTHHKPTTRRELPKLENFGFTPFQLSNSQASASMYH